MDGILGILYVALGAIIVENFVLVRILGIDPLLAASGKQGIHAGTCLSYVFFMGFAGTVGWLISEYLLVPLRLEYLKTVVFVLVIVAFTQLVSVFLGKLAPSLHKALGLGAPQITLNSAVLGVALLVTESGQSYSLLGALAYSFAAAVGFLLVLVLFSGIRERLQFSDCPASFEGLPIALVTVSLLAMVFTGFSGLKLF